MVERPCERACCCCIFGKLPFKENSCTEYALIGAIQGLARNVSIRNVFALQWITKLPYGTRMFQQTGMKIRSASGKGPSGYRVSGDWIEPPEVHTKKVILYFHGGAFVLQNAMAARWYVSGFSKYIGAKVFNANYGHPPQKEYLEIIEGLVATWDWITEKVAPEDIVLAGDSAGANMAASLALRLKYRGKDEKGYPAGLLLFSPWVCMYPFTSKSYKKNQDFDYISCRNIIQFMADMYVQDNDPENPLFSLCKLPEEMLVEMPPMFVSTGRCEVLYSSIVQFFENTKKARTHPVADVIYESEGGPHVAPMFYCAHAYPDVKYVPCLCRCCPCVAPCCCCGHCLVASDKEKAAKHPTWDTLSDMRKFLIALDQEQGSRGQGV